MASLPSTENEGSSRSPPPLVSMQKFKLYATQSNFYMIARDKSKTFWRVLKIGRSDPSELSIREDSTTYSRRECSELLKRIDEGNRVTGGLKFVTPCYGIIGFIKFLGPYYMLLITERRLIGAICGHNVYAVSKTAMIPLPHSRVQCTTSNSKDENRYKRLMRMVDLTKDFFFSYSYHIMHSLQKTLCNKENVEDLYEAMFVWNAFLTREIRDHLQNTMWTVALVYGFFKQAKISVAGREFKFTLIARRSRHYAGTRYLKRGVSEDGSVANDVETEQIISEDVPDDSPIQISSVVQNRGSIPLFWSQETSRLNLKPDIVLSKMDQNYEATRLHFENLAKRYGNPIIILNLIKTQEKRPRESILRAEFANAIDFINKDLSEENRLKFLHWDLHKHFQSKATNVLALLGKVAAYALTLTGLFYCRVTSTMEVEGLTTKPSCMGENPGNSSQNLRNTDKDVVNNIQVILHGTNDAANGIHTANSVMLQHGVLRTNCIDCLDRTNVAQYAYGLAALGEQLYALGGRGSPKIDIDDPLADHLMGFYERMGDTLAHQYGGSAAHNKVFSDRRGQWRAATQSQEFFRTLQRYYSNAYMDPDKQDAINVFLGNFQPQLDKPAVWEIRPHLRPSGQNGDTNMIVDGRSFMRRWLSDGNLLVDSGPKLSAARAKQESLSTKIYPDQRNNIMSESSPVIPASESEISLSRCTPTMPHRHILEDGGKDRCLDNEHVYCTEHGEASNFSNFVDLDWLSSSANSFDEEQFDRSSVLTSSPAAGLSSENVISGLVVEATPSASGYGSSSMKGREQTGSGQSSGNLQQKLEVFEGFSDSFVHWVNYGEALCH